MCGKCSQISKGEHGEISPGSKLKVLRDREERVRNLNCQQIPCRVKNHEYVVLPKRSHSVTAYWITLLIWRNRRLTEDGTRRSRMTLRHFEVWIFYLSSTSFSGFFRCPIPRESSGNEGDVSG